MKIVVFSLVALMVLFAIAPSGAAPMNPLDQAKSELNTAKTHAGFAASSDSMNGVSQHTGHAVNCLVGAGDKRFNAKWGNVCEGQGSGILADLKAAGANGAAALKISEDAAKLGADVLGMKDLAAAQAGARKLAGMLDDALKAIR